MNETLDLIIAEVKLIIREDVLAADLKLVLFSAALLSYRRDSCLRPFPDEFGDDVETNDEKMTHLEKMVDQLPPLEDILSHKTVISDECWKLLHWLLQTDKLFNAKICDKHKLKELEGLTCKSSFNVQPNYVYKIMYSTKASEKFDEQTKRYGIKYGYHGSRMDNFYSIVSNGLQVHMVKNGLYGSGIYLSEDLSVTMPYVKGGHVWKHSKLGEQVSCVAVCEILDHPGVKCQTQEADKKDRRIAENSEMGEVPHKYFVVTNSELVRIKYLLVFTDQKSTKKVEKHKSWSLFKDYPVATILFLYVILLCCMSLWRSNIMKIYWKKYFDRSEDDDDL